MKNIYSILSLFLLLFTISVFGQSDIYSPELKAPEDLEIDQMPDVTLDWNAVTGVTLEITYEVQLATNPEFTDAVTFPRTEVTAQSTDGLLFGVSYFWRVKAYDADEPSDWSTIWSFTVIDQLSFTISPKAGRLVFATQEINWGAVSGLTKYQIQLDTSYTWQLTHTVTTKAILGSFVFPNGNKWIVGEEGLIMYFDGSNWTSYNVSEDITFNDVFFINESSGYAVGDESVAYYYDGSSWSAIDINIGSDYFGVTFVDENTGWVVGAGGVIIKYLNGDWSLAQDTVFIYGSDTTELETDLYAINRLNDTNVWACGKSKIIAHFDGTEWKAKEVGTKDLNDIYFDDENNGYVVGKSGTVFHYNGTEWTAQESNITYDLFGVSFSGDVGYAVGDKGTLIAYNEGVWEMNSSGVDYKLYTVDVLSDEEIVAMGENGIIIDYGGGDFNSPFAHFINISPDSNEYQFTNLFFGQPYYYRLRGIHALDTSTWSRVKSIRTYAKPTLSSPLDNSQDLDLLITFDWTEFKGVTNYIFEVDTDENFSQPGSFAPDNNTLSVNDFVFGMEYFWKVAAQHAEDISEWSDVWSFTTLNTITLESPENEAMDISSCPMFTWVEVVGASEYELWVDVDASFNEPHMFVTDDPFNQCQSQMEKNTVYFWKVRGISGAEFSEWSDTWSFKTEGYIGIDEQFNSNSVNIFPNPGDGEFTLNIVSLTNDNYTVKVIDITGKTIYKSEIQCQTGSNNIPVSLDNVRNGAYNLIITNGEQVVTKQLLIQ